jgi:thimet oligopeptidase
MLRRSPVACLAVSRLMLAVADYKIVANKVDSASACAALFPQTKEGIATLVASAKAQTEAALKAITETTAARDYDNTVRAADLSAANLSVAACSLALVKDTHVDKDIRAAAAEAVVELEKLSIDAFSSNKALYKAFTAVPQSAVDAASTQRKYWFDEKMLDFKSKGLELPDDQFAEVVALRKRLAELDTKFSENIAEDKRTIAVPVAECAGVPQPILDGCKKVDDDTAYELGMDYPTYFGVMKNCTVAATRKAMASAFENRAHPANMDVLHEVIQLRHQLATKLGFASYAHLDLSDKMAKAPEKATAFVESLIPKMAAKWEIERAKLVDAGLPESVELVDGKSFRSYDLAFVMNRFKQDRLAVDEQAIREYFPLESTVKALYDIYEKFFDISFETVKADGAGFWHPEVEAMAVTDKRTGKLLGHVILDLFPREGKFSHACCHGILPPLQHEDGNFAPAVSVVVANFPKATADRPALFLHDDVETFFHEFGHAIHFLWGRGEMATTAGYNCKMDFVELPSQMLEEWMWHPAVLKQASKHYKTGEPLPDDLIAKKIESKRAFSGRDGLRQLTFATTALTLFNDKMGAVEAASQIDTSAAIAAIDARIMTSVTRNPDSHFQCSFGHLLGYGACYYGYMWSKVFALDVFGEIKKADGLLDPTVGRKYADTILGCGGGRDPNDSLKMFLGRDPAPDAFFKDMGL